MDIPKIKTRMLKDLKKNIPELSDNKYKFSVSELPSKKNSVISVAFNRKPQKFPKEFIIKIFNTGKMSNEIDTLNKLNDQKLHVPKIIFSQKPYLILEKLNGINICDFINDNLKGFQELNDLEPKLKDQIIQSIERLAEFLAHLHEKNITKTKTKNEMGKYVLNKGDVRLRDFIIDFSKDILYAVDFEDSFEGNHIDDLAWICCSLLDTDPGIFEIDEPHAKIDLINLLLRNYYKTNSSFPFDFNYFAEKIIEDLNLVIKRRNLPFSHINKTNFIKDISKEI